MTEDNSYSVAIEDLDLDGDIDIVVANVGAPNAIFLNENNATTWKKFTLNEQKFSTYDIIVTDLNGDKRPDIIEANSDEVNLYYFNQLLK
jgi:hypothetical protein